MWKVTWRGLVAHKLRLALTACAVVLGVSFVSGVLVLTDTLHNTFSNLFGQVYQHVDLEVRATAAFTAQDQAVRNPIPQSIAATVAKVPGVAASEGVVGGFAQLVDSHGKAVGGLTSIPLGTSMGPVRQLSAVTVVQGRLPLRDGEMDVDLGTATKYGFALGQRVRVLFIGPPETFTVVGIMKFGTADNLAGAMLVGFDLQTAQRVFDLEGKVNAVNILADHSANDAALAKRVEAVLPAGLQVVTGQTLAAESASALDNALGFLSTALIIFALIAVFVGAFIIVNTFNILVKQRTGEFALLRALGASRRQVLAAVAAEALVVGALASVAGLVLGLGIAVALKALFGAVGLALPAGGMVFAPRTIAVGLAVGIAVTLLSSLYPAYRAGNVPPMAALADIVPPVLPLRRRVIAGAALAAAGALALVLGVSGSAVSVLGHGGSAVTKVGIGAVLIFFGAISLAPLVAPPVVSVVGLPLARLRRAPGVLGRQNALRDPRRTASTAAALMIGLTLVSTIAVLGASISQSATGSIDDAIAGNYVITSNEANFFSASAVDEVDRVPGALASPVLTGPFELAGEVKTLEAISPASLGKTLVVHVTAGSAASLDEGRVLVDTTTADSDHLHVGQPLAVRFAGTGYGTLVVGGIYKPNILLGSYVVSDTFYATHFTTPQVLAIVVKAAAGSALAAGKGPLVAALADQPNLVVRTTAEYKSFETAQVNKLLVLVYALLLLAVLIALLGIVNTLALSVFERVRELGLLRAVGMQRRQVRTMIRVEAVIVALFGAILGLVLGTIFGTALAASLRHEGIVDRVVPVSSLVVFLVLSGLAGLVAASWPARRAARLNVLDAIATA